MIIHENESMDNRTFVIRQADENDVGALARVINAAFAVERFFKNADRIDAKGVKASMAKGHFLIAEDATGIAACIHIELRGERGYFGLLSVDPSRQKAGLGRKMVEAAEDFMRRHGCKWSDMHIVNLRTELPAFYAKLGYGVIGSEPFTGQGAPDVACHFINFTKKL